MFSFHEDYHESARRSQTVNSETVASSYSSGYDRNVQSNITPIAPVPVVFGQRRNEEPNLFDVFSGAVKTVQAISNIVATRTDNSQTSAISAAPTAPAICAAPTAPAICAAPTAPAICAAPAINTTAPAFFAPPQNIVQNPAVQCSMHITIDKADRCFRGGDIITGVIIIQSEKPDCIKDLSIRAEGMASTMWTESESRHVNKDDGTIERVTTKSTYKGEEKVFKTTVSILGMCDLNGGTTHYPFSVALPSNLPSTMKGDHGEIKYSLSAALERSWGSSVSATATFQVDTSFDVNRCDGAREPVSREDTESFGCLCCASGPCSLNACIPLRGYFPGQDIHFTVRLDNATSSSVEVTAKLIKTTYWVSKKPSKNRTNSIKRLNIKCLGKVNSRDTRTWNEKIRLPDDTKVINTDECSIISTVYSLKIDGDVDRCGGGTVSVNLPILVGSLPLEPQTKFIPY